MNGTSQRMFCHVVGGKFNHFHSSKIGVTMYGGDHAVVEVELTVDDDGPFWCWREKSGRMSMVFSSLMQLNVCSHDFFESAEARGDGRRVRVSVKLTS